MRQANILLVDDTRENLQLLRDLLTEQGYLVRPVSNGAAAISAAQFKVPDVILLDIMMPGMDGYEVCRRLKADERTQDVPVIFISSLQETFDKVQAFSVGGVDYITKPFQEQEVLARVTTHLTLRQQHIALQEERERFQKLADAAFEGIVVYEHGDILDVNQTLLEMLGYDRTGELIGKNAFEWIISQSCDQPAELMNTDHEAPHEAQAVRRDGTVFPVELRTRAITWQGRQASVMTIRDMSVQHMLAHEERAFRIALEGREHFGRLIGKSPVMRKVYETILRSAASDAPVMIYGETGTGKEITARTVFEMSDHHTTCFVPVNCASIPENLFESEFFGHRKGAFTGAHRDHAGYFEQAHGGTLFLDEIGELSVSMQAKLLRVLQDQTYTPVGSKNSRRADVRLIAATNKNLRLLVNQGKVRSDFFHRLHVLAIDLPPLREHKEDIALFIAHFSRQQAEVDTLPPIAALPSDLLDRFYAYDWPGNVRELFNELRRYITTGQVELSGELPADTTEQLIGAGIPDDLSLTSAIERFEHYYIPRTLQRHGGHKGNTADILGIDRKTLYRKLKKYGLLS